ncbi:hypothetical protein C8R44DRAFT_881482 [Mycena epipterygia]|nr:hypothetical protein C8R44DRAFT_881482 [Mycena epipterygia]
MKSDDAQPKMALLLPKINLPAEEMVPDTENEEHDPRYWCLPPVREDLSAPQSGGGQALHLVTNGHQVGIFQNWTVAHAMVSGHPAGAHHGHKNVAGCVKEWQEHCVLGVHPHAPDPSLSRIPSVSVAPRKTGSSSLGAGRPVEPKLQAEMKKICLPNVERPTPGASRVHAPSPPIKQEERPAPQTFYAIWNGRTVFTKQSEAKAAFLKAARAGREPTLRTTGSYDEAHAYSMGAIDCD